MEELHSEDNSPIKESTHPTQAEEDFVDLMDKAVGYLVKEMPRNVVGGMLHVLKQSREMTAMIDSTLIARKRVILQISLGIELDDSKQRVIPLSGQVIRTLNTVIAQSSLCLLVHLVNVNQPNSPRPGVRGVAEQYLQTLVDSDIIVVDHPSELSSAMSMMQPAGVEVVDNLLLLNEELNCNKDFAMMLSSKCDVFINESFETHHLPYATTTTLLKTCERHCFGFQHGSFRNALLSLNHDPPQPFVAYFSCFSSSISAILFEAIIQCVCIASSVHFGGRLSLLHANCEGNSDVFLENGVSSPTCTPFTESEQKAMRGILLFAQQLNRKIISSLDHRYTVKRTKGKKKTEVSTKLPIPAVGTYTGIGPASEEKLFCDFASAKSGLMVGPIALSSSKPKSATISFLRRLCETPVVKTNKMILIGDDLHQSFQSTEESIANTPTIIPYEEAALSFFAK